jgi:hypothetical protein
MLGIVIGVMSVIILVAMVTGLQTYITSQISSFGSNLIFVIPGTVGGGRGPGGAQVNRIEIQDALALKNKIGSDALISSVVQKVGTVKYSNKTSKNVSFFGVESSYFKIITAIKIKKGRIFSQSESDGGKKVALIGTTVASTLFKNSDPIGQQIMLGQRLLLCRRQVSASQLRDDPVDLVIDGIRRDFFLLELGLGLIGLINRDLTVHDLVHLVKIVYAAKRILNILLKVAVFHPWLSACTMRLRPMPGIAAAGRSRRNVSMSCMPRTVTPAGFLYSPAIFASSLLGPTPTETEIAEVFEVVLYAQYGVSAQSDQSRHR